MADFDTDVALQAKGYSPQDAVAPLQAYYLAQQGRNLETDNQLAQLKLQQGQATFGAQQNYAKTLATPGADQAAGLSASGLPAFDPEGAKAAYGNIQAGNTLGAISNYGAHPTDPTSLAKGGPELVGQGAIAQNTLATASQTNQAVAGQRQDQIGQLALGFLHSDRSESARQTTLAMAHDSSLFHDPTTGKFNDLMYHSFQTMPLGQFTERAKQLAASGSGSVINSGDAAGDVARETSLNTFQKSSPGETISAPPPLLAAMNGGPPPAGFANPALTSGGAPPAQSYGRSAAVDGQPPAAPAQGNGGRAPAPANSQPPLMTQAESQYGLPTNYLGRTAQIESGGRANASNPSGAAGMFQFMPSTWAKYAQPGQSPYDPQAATVAAARLAADNSAQLTRVLGRPPTGAELYLSHQQGAGGAAALLSNPNASAASIVGAKAVIQNGGSPSMTAGQFAGMWEKRYNGQGGGNFNLSGPSPMGPGVSMPSPEPTSTLPGAGGLGLRAAAGVDTSPQTPMQPDLAPPVAGPIPLPSSTQPMPSPPAASFCRSASDGSAPPARAPAGGLQPVVQGMTPFQYAKQGLDAQRAVEEEKTARDQFVTAGAAQSGLMQLSEDLTKLDPKNMQNLRDTFLSEGAGAETRIGLAKTVNSVLSSAGMAPLFDQDKIAAAESAAKTTGRLGFGDAGSLGRGEAASIVHQAIGLNPSVVNTPAGQKLLIGSLLAAQQRQKDFYLYQQQYKENNGGNPLNAETDFDVNRPPMTYVQDAQRLSKVPLQSVKILQAHPNNPAAIATFNKTYGPGLARYYLGSRTDY